MPFISFQQSLIACQCIFSPFGVSMGCFDFVINNRRHFFKFERASDAAENYA